MFISCRLVVIFVYYWQDYYTVFIDTWYIFVFRWIIVFTLMSAVIRSCYMRRALDLWSSIGKQLSDSLILEPSTVQRWLVVYIFRDRSPPPREGRSVCLCNFYKSQVLVYTVYEIPFTGSRMCNVPQIHVPQERVIRRCAIGDPLGYVSSCGSYCRFSMIDDVMFLSTPQT